MGWLGENGFKVKEKHSYCSTCSRQRVRHWLTFGFHKRHAMAEVHLFNVPRQGSGFFINEKGHFITCYHVLKGAYSVYVKIEYKEEQEVDHVIAQDADWDLVKLTVSIP